MAIKDGTPRLILLEPYFAEVTDHCWGKMLELVGCGAFTSVFDVIRYSAKQVYLSLGLRRWLQWSWPWRKYIEVGSGIDWTSCFRLMLLQLLQLLLDDISIPSIQSRVQDQAIEGTHLIASQAPTHSQLAGHVSFASTSTHNRHPPLCSVHNEACSDRI